MLINPVKTEHEIKIVEKLAREIWNQHYLPIIGKEQVDYMLNKYQSFDAIKNSIDSGYIYYIAYHNQKPCGYCAIKKDRGIFLSKFYVLESYRGLGLGKAMLNTIFEYADAVKEKRIWLTCNKYNLASLAAYKKMGFDIIDEIVTDIGSGFVMDDYVLEKEMRLSQN